MPTDPIGQLRAWVENGTVPETLRAVSPYAVNASASAAVGGMDLCPYPAVNRYDGTGDPMLAGSYRCDAGTEWESFPGPSLSNYSYVGGPGWYGSSFPEVEI